MHWLIASMGRSPEVLTEAIYHLESQKLAVGRVTCVGTKTAQEDAEKRVFETGGALNRLRKSLNKPDSWLTPGNGFHWEVEPLKAVDNRDLAEAKAMDRAFRRAVLHAQREGDGPVVACISGGRKTMSSSLQQAMALLAREQDWAFHVLLNVPEGMEEENVTRMCRDAQGKELPRFAFPGDPLFPEFSKVGVDAFRVPLVKLREFAASRKIDLANPKLVAQLQRVVDELSQPPRLFLNLGELRPIIVIGDQKQTGERLTWRHALLLGAWIYAGEPIKRQESRKFLLAVYREWSQTPEFFSNRGVDSKAVMQCIDLWTSETSKGQARFQENVSRLGSELEERGPLMDPFVIRSLAPQATKNPPYGFMTDVYAEGRAKILRGNS